MTVSDLGISADSWFHTPEAATLFAQSQRTDLEWVTLAQGVMPLPMLVLEAGGRKNLIPSYGYAGVRLDVNHPVDLDTFKLPLQRSGATAVFFALQETGLEQFGNDPSYVARLPSYEMDLRLSEAELRSNVSKRRRSKLVPKIDQPISFCDNDKERLLPFFLEYYTDAMARLNACGRFVFDHDILTALCMLPSTDMIGVLIEDKIELVMLHGHVNGRAEFIFSGTSEAGRNLASIALWHSALWYQSNGMTHFHLGGGMKVGDGLDDFKRQLGGTRLLNGGLKYVLEPELYAELCARMTQEERESGFFPPYLRRAILG